MRGRYKELNWEGSGYHGFPVERGQDDYVSAEDAEIWSEFDSVLASAKRGDFSRVSRLVTIYDETDSWMLGTACCDLIGDIGSRPLFETLRPAVTSVIDPTYSVDLGRSLAVWGNLTVVPTLLETLESIAEFVDAPALVQMISFLLEPEPGPLADTDGLHNFAAYASMVRGRFNDTAARVGTEDAIVLFGDLFSVERLIAGICDSVNGGRLDSYMRHKFEATTGVDCSGFYVDEILQPLRVLAIIEEFEDSARSEDYVRGKRYFFAHPVPD
ncbi:MAG: hypothetical protein U1E52_14680 [Geminicoccaceae bacterium]